MKIKNLKKRTDFLILNIALCVMLIFVFSCSSGGSSDSGGSGDAVLQTGSISFDLVMKTDIASLPEDTQTAQVNCEECLIKTVEVEIYDEKEEFLIGGGPWDCELGEGIVEDVIAGPKRTVRAIARGEDDVILFIGFSEPITVVPLQTASAGPIELSPVDTVTVTFDFEELPPTFDYSEPRQGALTSLISEKSGITIEISREDGNTFDLRDNDLNPIYDVPVDEFGSVSLDPFIDPFSANSAFIVNFSIPVSIVSVAMGDSNVNVTGEGPGDDEAFVLEAYSQADATGNLLDSDGATLENPSSPPPIVFGPHVTLVVAATDECIRSILMEGGTQNSDLPDQPENNSVIYDSIIVEAPCECLE